MKAFILAAGLGTRLKPWTLEHPKALVPVNGVPMLERVILRLKEQGFDDITVNVHHFAAQIKEFLAAHDYGVRIRISDESDLLLDTGGGLLHAAGMLFETPEPVLIHNVDILSDADLRALMQAHESTDRAATLLTSHRESSRKLVADAHGNLAGWHNLNSGEYRPAGFLPVEEMTEQAFSGIHVVGPQTVERMRCDGWKEVFPIMDFYLSECRSLPIGCHISKTLHIIDIGKPDSLARADGFLRSMNQ